MHPTQNETPDSLKLKRSFSGLVGNQNRAKKEGEYLACIH